MATQSIQESAVTLSPCHPVTLSPLRAWFALLLHCFQRQARARQMVWIALGLLTFTAAVIAINTAANRWTMGRRWYWMPTAETSQDSATSPRVGPFLPQKLSGPGAERVRMNFDTAVTAGELMPHVLPGLSATIDPAGNAATTALLAAVNGSARAVLDNTGFYVFSIWVVFSIFTGFLLPIWSLSFATEALGGEREGRTLVWLFSRPLPRWSVYLAKYLALLPWSVGLNLGGFALVCYLAGAPGRLALSLFWPAVLGGTLAYAALYHFMGACFRRAAVVALVYSFFLETILGSMPGYLKRVSLSFYTRCLMFDLADGYDVYTEKPSIYLPVDGVTAWWVLSLVTAGLLAAGMWVFTRTEYQDLT